MTRIRLGIKPLATLSACVGPFLYALLVPSAHAAGSSMPWEQPLQSILDSVQGPVAKIVAVIIIIVTGFPYVWWLVAEVLCGVSVLSISVGCMHSVGSRLYFWRGDFFPIFIYL